jgi:hypothetical protein
MRTNPNIILSGNQMAAPQLPDVNAMMQTRTAGMENIYAIEQQRAAQAQTAQKEQEAAAAEAMLPSVLAAYSDASDVGLDRATSLMPAEVRDTFAPFITRLKGIPDTATRKSILEAELAKDEAGRSVLARILTPYQEGTLGIQREQQEIARQRLAQDAAAAGVPKPMSAYEAERIKFDREKAEREAAKVSPDAAKQQQAVNDMKLAVTELTAAAAPGGLIDLSTGSIAGDWLDSLVAQGSGGFFTLPGDVAAAQMEVVAHLARMAVPRFEGPQSEKDAALYERASGQLANPTTSTTIKRAAAQTLIDIISKRKDQFVSSGVSTETAGGGADSGVLEYDADGNLIE